MTLSSMQEAEDVNLQLQFVLFNIAEIKVTQHHSRDRPKVVFSEVTNKFL